jgi:mannosyl-oligosaccharide alpha-1,3-glucosidase
MPLLMCGGYIFHATIGFRGSLALITLDPTTPIFTLCHFDDAVRELYLDDGKSYNFQQGAYVHHKFSFTETSSVL